MEKVIVGMSGGVDSSVTAHLLMDRGYEVEGISFILWEARSRSCVTTCCSLEATTGAAKTAAALGIKHGSVDVRGEFMEKVIEPFVEAYLRGETPNPCILCNRHIKFPYLLREAGNREGDLISTGHYARAVRDAGGAALLKGVDSAKDQSYVLYALRPEELQKLVLPLGGYVKQEVRRIARELQLDAADRPESQEICFIEDGNYAGFIEKLYPHPSEPGPIRDLAGKQLGTHNGIFRYTLGQRKGLGISSPDPYYVVKIDVPNNTVYVGRKEDAMISTVGVGQMHWLVPPGKEVFRATAKVRSMMADCPVTVGLSEYSASIKFDDPLWPPSPGQSAVIYDGDTVIGGGIIESCSS